METPHIYADGYKAYGEWPSIKFTGIYNNTSYLPYQLDNRRKKCKPVAIFIIGISRGKIRGDKCRFKCSMFYDYSVN